MLETEWFVGGVYHEGRKRSYLICERTILPKILKILTHSELVELSDSELMKRVGVALGRLDKAKLQGENTADSARTYQVYENELAKRNFRQRIR